MKPFLDRDFLLNSETARILYHDYAAPMPIFDYHCHLPPDQIAEDRRFEDIGEIWLGGDHYKWRALRFNGVPERYITGDASWEEKFFRWAETVPATIGNPLYHWTHLELQRYFGIITLLGPDTAREIRNRTNEQISGSDFSVRSLLTRMNVRYVGTTDDPVDDLRHHKALAESDFPVVVRPSFRPDKAWGISSPGEYRQWIEKLAAAADMEEISTFNHLREALRRRIDFFDRQGCRVSDHALTLPVNAPWTEGLVNGVLSSVLQGNKPAPEDVEPFTTAVLEFLVREYASRGWVLQLHIGAMRSVNSRMTAALGPDTGFDSITDGPVALKLAGFLNRMDREEALPRTILYGLNPVDNELLASIIGSFQDGSVRGKIQHGSGWWFNDQKDGMIRQMTSLANLGLLSRFVGMLTDSRSFLSFPRHEYFRRILADLVGGWVERGEAPADMKLLGSMMRDICWYNAHEYFGIDAVERE
ncbi:MAG: glucuronate isomerase [Spirochaetaceae bacterium]|nr:MAG: glucuronate isomerase [Spirochaetaceae bacterium]